MNYYALITSKKIDPGHIPGIAELHRVSDTFLLFESSYDRLVVEDYMKALSSGGACPLLLVQLTREHGYVFCGDDSARTWLASRVPVDERR